ncbi:MULTISPECIES: COG2426 family protein [Oscillospiraceae]|uniref:Membrane protein n=1 Tax=Harryflintia acetispora TaxID=1849041 RepID=A0A9X8UJJ6_9FIRM|nr:MULTISPECIES: small multi-drug export protein [Oscillospiraceae]RGB68359.1 small multidrug export protein [Harryflintia acetispora]TCL43706.1 putative membrane protein [Harryflintia acetispora]
MLDFLLSSLQDYPYLYVFLISMLPIIELRGGMIAAITALGLPFPSSYLVCVIGNLLPVPFLLLFGERVLVWCAKLPKIGGFFSRILVKADEKAHKIGKWELLGLMIFVAIPLPGSGAWTGSVIATLLRLRPLYAFFAIALGVLLAGVIMGFASFGLLGVLQAVLS